MNTGRAVFLSDPSDLFGHSNKPSIRQYERVRLQIRVVRST
jgi:hypothetical protein